MVALGEAKEKYTLFTEFSQLGIATMRRVALEDSTTVLHFWDEQNNSEPHLRCSASIFPAKINDSSKPYIVSVEPDGRFLYVDIQEQLHQEHRTVDVKRAYVTVFVFHPQQPRKGAIGMCDGRTYGVDFESKQIFLVSYFPDERITSVAFDETMFSPLILICATHMGNVYTVNWETGSRLQGWSLMKYHTHCAQQLLFYNSLLVCCSDDSMSCWRMNSNTTLKHQYEFVWSSPSLDSVNLIIPAGGAGPAGSDMNRKQSDSNKLLSFSKIIVVNTGIISAVGTKYLTKWVISESSSSTRSQLEPAVSVEVPFRFRHVVALLSDFLVVIQEQEGCNLEWAVMNVDTLEGIHAHKVLCSCASSDITEVSVISTPGYLSNHTGIFDSTTAPAFLALSFRNSMLAVVEIWSGAFIFQWEYKPLPVVHKNSQKTTSRKEGNIRRDPIYVSCKQLAKTENIPDKIEKVSQSFRFSVNSSSTLAAVKENDGTGISFVHFPTFLKYHKCSNNKMAIESTKFQYRLPNCKGRNGELRANVCEEEKKETSTPWWALAHSGRTSTFLAEVISYRPLLHLHEKYVSQWVNSKLCDLTAVGQRNLSDDAESNHIKMMASILFEEKEILKFGTADPVVRYATGFQRLRSHLSRYGSFPALHRPLIWRFVLGLPPKSQTAALFASLERKQQHHCVAALMDSYPLPSSQVVVKRRIETVLSVLAWHAPVFGILEILPAIVYPFAHVFGDDVQTLSEVMMLLFLNWGKEFFSYHPQAPPELMTFLVQLLRLEDPELLLHLQKVSSPVEVWGWEIVQVFYTDSLSASEWVQLMDHVFLMVPLWLMVFHVCFLKAKRDMIFSCRTSLEVLKRLQSGAKEESCGLPLSHIIQETYRVYRHYNFPINHGPSNSCSCIASSALGTPVIVCPQLYTFFESIYPFTKSELLKPANGDQEGESGLNPLPSDISCSPFLRYRTRYICDNDVLRERSREMRLRAQRLIDISEARHRRAADEYEARLDSLQQEYIAQQTQQLYHAKSDAAADASQSGIHLAKTRQSIAEEMGGTPGIQVPILSPPFLNHPYGQELSPRYPLPTPTGRTQ